MSSSSQTETNRGETGLVSVPGTSTVWADVPHVRRVSRKVHGKTRPPRHLHEPGDVGMHRRTEYRAWWNMVGRCTDELNPSWEKYGARGIRVCDEWRDSFEAFYAHVGQRPSDKHSIGRIEPYGNYEPGNVVWQTSEEQRTSHRDSLGKVRVTVDGVTKSIAQWARHSGLHYKTLYDRLRSGWDPVAAVTTPRPAKEARLPWSERLQSLALRPGWWDRVIVTAKRSIASSTAAEIHANEGWEAVSRKLYEGNDQGSYAVFARFVGNEKRESR